MIAKPQGENKSKPSRELLPSWLQWETLQPPQAADTAPKMHTLHLIKYPNIRQ